MDSQNIIKDSSVSAMSAGISAVLAALQAIIVARLLGPTLYGTLQVYRLVITYASFNDLGTFWAMVREISFYRGKGEIAEIAAVKNGTFTINLIISVLTAIMIVFLFIFLGRPYTTSMTETIIVGLIVLAQSAFFFSRHYFVAVKKFVVRSVLIMVYSLCNILFVLLLGIPFGLKGVLLAMLLALVAGIIFSIKKGALRIHFGLSKSTTLNLIKTGIPIWGNGLLALAVTSVDRLMIIYFLPAIQLGYYGIAAMLKTFMEALYRSLFLTVFPRLTERYGETDDVGSLWGYVWKPLLISAHLSPLFFGTMIILIPPMITYILPKYTYGVLAAQLIVASSFFGCLQVGIMNFFITINRVHRVYPLRIATLVFSAVAIWFSIVNGYGIEGVAVCVLLSSVLLAGLLIHTFLRHNSITPLLELKHFALVYYPFLYMCLGLWLIRFASITHSSPLMADLLNTLFRLVLFFVLNIPLLVIVQFKTGILVDIGKMIIQVVDEKLLRNSPA